MLVVRGLGLGAAFAVSLLLARDLGAADFGVYTIAISAAMMLAVPGRLGLDQTLTRELAHIADVGSADAAIRAFRRSASRSAIVALLITIFAGLGLGLQVETGSPMVIALLIALTLVPLSAGQSLVQAGLAGISRPVQSQAVIETIGPVVALTGVAAVGATVGVSPVIAVAIVAASTALAVLVGAGLLVVQWQAAFTTSRPQPAVERDPVVDGIWALAIVNAAIFAMSRVDVLMIGGLRDESQAAIYSIASIIAALVNMVTMSVVLIYRPQFEQYVRRQDGGALQRVVRLVTVCSSLGALVFAIAFALAGPAVLRLYGTDFEVAYSPTWLLIAGHAVFSVLGPAIPLLMMARDDRYLVFSTVTCLLGNVALNLLLIPRFGIDGAVIATLATLLAWHGHAVWRVGRRWRIDTTLLAVLKPARAITLRSSSQ
ncbi:MAG: polysaccharide biosynthesis C-terminal domain-containing protein [Planctomycetota bacterium]